MATQLIEYKDNDVLLEGFLAYDDSIFGPRPAVLVAPDWSGRNAMAEQKATQLAELGYAAFAVDMYGKGILGQTNEEKTQLITPLMENRQVLRQRIQAAFETVQQLDIVDNNQIAAIGYCFGGLCVLDLARSGAKVRGAVSFHGLLNAPENVSSETITSKVLVLHGYDDPMVSPEQLQIFAKEMTDAKVDWQIHAYGNTLHAFTNPQANDPDFGTVYDAVADRRSWQATQNFLDEVFS